MKRKKRNYEIACFKNKNECINHLFLKIARRKMTEFFLFDHPLLDELKTEFKSCADICHFTFRMKNDSTIF